MGILFFMGEILWRVSGGEGNHGSNQLVYKNLENPVPGFGSAKPSG